jgi:hypothetical protein
MAQGLGTCCQTVNSTQTMYLRLLLPLLLLPFLGIAQATNQTGYESINTSINDDDNELSISVTGRRTDGQTVRYNRVFPTKGLTKAQRDAITDRILDSLGVNPTPHSSTPAPTSEAVTFVCPTCTGAMRLEVSGNGYKSTYEFDSKKDKQPAFPLALRLPPGTYRYEYWQNRVQQMYLPFTVKVGEKNVVTVK